MNIGCLLGFHNTRDGGCMEAEGTLHILDDGAVRTAKIRFCPLCGKARIMWPIEKPPEETAEPPAEKKKEAAA